MTVLGRGLRLAVGIGLMAVLLYVSNPSEVAASLAGASPLWLLAALGLVVVDRGANAYRWLVLLRAIEPGRRIALTAVLHVFFVSGFMGSFLPGSVGGDAVRAFSLSRLDVPAADAFASVVVDRLLGISSVLLMAAGGLVAVDRLFDEGTRTILWLSVGIPLAGILLLLFDTGALGRVVTGVVPRRLERIRRPVDRALAAIRQYGRYRTTLVGVLAVSVGVQVLRTLQAWSLGQALGLQTGIGWYFAFIPVVVLVMLLPTSVAGLGTGALAFQLLFGTVGVTPAESFALATLFSATAIIGTLPGGILLAFDRRKARTP